CSRSSLHRKHPYGPRDVLEAPLAHIVECDIEAVAHLVAHEAADANSARLSQCLQPRRDIDAVAMDVTILDDDIAQINADTKFDAPLGRDRRIAFGHAFLHRDRAGDRLNNARELYEDAVA